MNRETIEALLWICTAINTIGAAIIVLTTFIGKAKAPNLRQNERLDNVEKEIDTIKHYLDSDNKRIKSIEEGNKVTQKALLALMSHALNGNDNDKLLAAKDELERYLIDR